MADLAGTDLSCSERNSGGEKAEKSEFYGHVLVAEDVATNQTLVRLLLERMGLDVTIVSDGKEAVEVVRAEHFDLILMDIQMPNMNGFEATIALRDQGITTPIIALTANAMQGDKDKCLEAGCDDYISKPIAKEELRRILDKFVSVGSISD